MNPPCATAWAELAVWKEWKDVERTSEHDDPWSKARHTWTERAAEWQIPDALSVHDDRWQNPLDIPRRFDNSVSGFTYRNHAQSNNRYATGGHNWYMTTRFDVWFHHPHDGWEWYGCLITGGDNAAFRVRRTKTSHLLDVPRCLHTVLGKTKHKFVAPVIEWVDDAAWRIADGAQTLWFARVWNQQWYFGQTVGDLFAARLLRDPA